MTEGEVLDLLRHVQLVQRDDLAQAFEIPDMTGLAVVSPRHEDQWHVSLTAQTGITDAQGIRCLTLILPKVVRLIAHHEASYDDGTSWQWHEEQKLWFSAVCSVRYVVPSYVPPYFLS